MSRLAIIPARGDSKRIPNKNIRDFCGQPMITYVLKVARESGLFDKIHVSTESEAILDVVERFGLPVDFMRLKELADDHTPIMPVLKYVLEEYRRRGIKFQSVALLMACAPLITSGDLLGAAALFDANYGKQAVLGVAEFPCPVEWAFRREANGALVPMQPGMFAVRSQDLGIAYYDAGQFCFMPSEQVLASVGAGTDKGLLGYPIKRHQAIDIDTLDDWRFAEFVFSGIRQNAERT